MDPNPDVSTDDTTHFPRGHGMFYYSAYIIKLSGGLRAGSPNWSGSGLRKQGKETGLVFVLFCEIRIRI